MIEKYYKYKSKYQDYIIFLEIGAFYEVIGVDSLIINHLLGYKLKKISNTFKCGFPLSKVNDVSKELGANHINYIVVKNDEIKEKQEFETNNYNNYSFNERIVFYNFLRIEKISNILSDNITKLDIDEKLSKIEEIINIS